MACLPFSVSPTTMVGKHSSYYITENAAGLPCCGTFTLLNFITLFITFRDIDQKQLHDTINGIEFSIGFNRQGTQEQVPHF